MIVRLVERNDKQSMLRVVWGNRGNILCAIWIACDVGAVMVRYGVVRYVVVWYGGVWNGVVWCGVVR